ncbi:hypothetical protein ACU7M1_32715, partial [Burkholderia pseudomallei]
MRAQGIHACFPSVVAVDDIPIPDESGAAGPSSLHAAARSHAHGTTGADTIGCLRRIRRVLCRRQRARRLLPLDEGIIMKKHYFSIVSTLIALACACGAPVARAAGTKTETPLPPGVEAVVNNTPIARSDVDSALKQAGL